MNQQNRRYVCLAFLFGSAFLGVLNAQTFTYTTFDVPEAAQDLLNVDSINGAGVIAGYLTDTSGNMKGWIRDTDGTITLLVDPLDTNTPTATVAFGLSNGGTTTGYFYDTAAGLYNGYFYVDGNYKHTVFPTNLPVQTRHSAGSITRKTSAGSYFRRPTQPTRTLSVLAVW